MSIICIDLTFFASYTRSFLFAVKLRTRNLNLGVYSKNIMNAGRDKTTQIIFHDLDNQSDIYFLNFFSYISKLSKNVFKQL